jgi:hypothetical protein
MSVRAVGKPGECIIHVPERFGLHFEQRNVDVVPQMDIRRFGRVHASAHFSVGPAVLTDVSKLDAEIVLELAASSLEHLLQVSIACLAHDLSF